MFLVFEIVALYMYVYLSDNGVVFSCKKSVDPLSTKRPNQIDSSTFHTWNYTVSVSDQISTTGYQLTTSDSLQTVPELCPEFARGKIAYCIGFYAVVVIMSLLVIATIGAVCIRRLGYFTGNNERSNAGAKRPIPEENSTVYAAVVKGNMQRPAAATDYDTAKESSTVYSSIITEGRNEPNRSKEPLANPRERNPKNYVADDGTECMEMNSSGKSPPV